jgi:hypothetical protein
MPGRLWAAKPSHLRVDVFLSSKQARGGSSMKAVASVLCVRTVFLKPQQPDKTRPERGKNHESAWDQAEQNKDANAFENLLAESLDYVVTTDPSARSSNFWQAGRGQTSPESRSTTRTRPCDCTATMWQRAPASTGTKACQTANRSRAVYERLAESKWPMGMHCQPIDFDYALMAEESERQGTTILCGLARSRRDRECRFAGVHVSGRFD